MHRPRGKLRRIEIVRALPEPPHRVLQRIDQPLHGGSRRVDLVRDAGDQHTQRRHAFGVNQRTLRGAELAQRILDLALRVLQLGGAFADLHLQILREGAHFRVEPRVLDRGRRLIGERHQQAQVGLLEARLAQAPDQDHADDALFQRQRRGNHGAH